ncbi:MAG: sigma-70 family RNA polymerase sigma factor [Cyclobacteriaceae bacterium]
MKAAIKESDNQEHLIDLWSQIRKGCMESLGDLYDCCIDSLFSYGSRYTDDKELLKDCLHDLFVDLHKYHSKVADTDNVEYYLFSSLKRKILKKTPKKGKVISLDPSYLKGDLFQYSEDSFEDVLISNEEKQERVKWLNYAMKLLPSKQRRCLSLRFEDELSYDEIALKMNISVPSVRTLVYRTIMSLRKNRRDIKKS